MVETPATTLDAGLFNLLAHTYCSERAGTRAPVG